MEFSQLEALVAPSEGGFSFSFFPLYFFLSRVKDAVTTIDFLKKTVLLRRLSQATTLYKEDMLLTLWQMICCSQVVRLNRTTEPRLTYP